MAGARAGLAGARSGLFMEQIRIVKEMRDADRVRGRPDELLRPRFMGWENVLGAFSSGCPKSEDFRIVLEEIARIKCGPIHVPRPDAGRWEPAGRIILGTVFSLAWRVFDAQYWGVPQRRRRIYLVLDLTGQRAGEILFKCEGLRGYFETGGTEGQGTATDAPGGFGAGDRPISYTLKIRSGCEGGGKGPLTGATTPLSRGIRGVGSCHPSVSAINLKGPRRRRERPECGRTGLRLWFCMSAA